MCATLWPFLEISCLAIGRETWSSDTLILRSPSRSCQRATFRPVGPATFRRTRSRCSAYSRAHIPGHGYPVTARPDRRSNRHLLSAARPDEPGSDDGACRAVNHQEATIRPLDPFVAPPERPVATLGGGLVVGEWGHSFLIRPTTTPWMRASSAFNRSGGTSFFLDCSRTRPSASG